MENRLLSVITINYNNRDGLLKTFESVRKQTDKGFEYIVVDGGSTDGSKDIIEGNIDIIDEWVSEKDGGIYNAMNKGVRMASGRFVFFLNSGDVFYDERTIKKILPHLDSEYNIVAGRSCLEENSSMALPPGKLSLPFFIQQTLHHQSTFIDRKLLLDNPYDETLKIVSDWKFFIECFLLDKLHYRAVKNVISRYDVHGFSSINHERLVAERQMVLRQLNVNLYDEYLKIPWLVAAVFDRPVPPNHRFGNFLARIDSFLVNLYRLFKK